ncbi:hypothetical protein LTR47_003100 [Exophiala xenobiotica]|nr:hypothetical protein LTR41_001824 [Exophiala xenobiotica]KAK5235627.1 hypothetical protein LTR47_003100 [Exophiala xenobiotica]KAK5366673.1 hypothetical protein LTS03_008586 [Exophiala xenobiotica]
MRLLHSLCLLPTFLLVTRATTSNAGADDIASLTEREAVGGKCIQVGGGAHGYGICQLKTRQKYECDADYQVILDIVLP